MINSQTTKPNAVLALAQYAHARTEPLFAQAKQVEPSIEFSIEMTFADQASAIFHDCFVTVRAHWSRDGMFQWSPNLQSMEEVDAYAAKLANDVAALRPLETGIAA